MERDLDDDKKELEQEYKDLQEQRYWEGTDEE